jgi:hypothetical protein
MATILYPDELWAKASVRRTEDRPLRGRREGLTCCSKKFDNLTLLYQLGIFARLSNRRFPEAKASSACRNGTTRSGGAGTL